MINLLRRVKTRLLGSKISVRPNVLKNLLLNEVEVLFDVGANIGQSVHHYRSMGYSGKIISYEPIKEIYQTLISNYSDDPDFIGINMGLSDVKGKDNIFITANGAVASSLLPMTDIVKKNAPAQSVLAKEEVDISTLEEQFQLHYPQGKNAFLKLDVQGLESQVIDGAGSCLDQIIGMKVETAVVENYKGEKLLYDLVPEIMEKGFRVSEISPGFRSLDQKELLQVDVFFIKP